MKVVLKDNRCIVTKEPSDPIFRNSGWDKSRPGDAGESRFLYHIKLALIQQGYDLIKKRMAKDGHLVDDHQQYLRTRKPSSNPAKNICVYNDRWAIEGAEEQFNKTGQSELTVVTDIFTKKELT